MLRYSRNGKELSIPRKFMKDFPDIFVDSEIWYTNHSQPSISSYTLHSGLAEDVLETHLQSLHMLTRTW